MVKILCHVRAAGSIDWRKETRGLSRVPAVGEHIALAGGAWYKVSLVLHQPEAKGVDMQAEIFAVEVEESVDALKRAFATLADVD